MKGTKNSRIADAGIFVIEKHGLQNRMYDSTPYFFHCFEVANILIDHRITDEDVLCTAILHDVLEDTDTHENVIADRFGYKIAGMVMQCTNHYTTNTVYGNRFQRKQMENNRIANCDADIQNIKIADAISNCRKLMENNPDFAKTYFKEKIDLALKCDKADERLKATLLAIIITKIDGKK